MIKFLFSLICGIGLLISLCGATWASQNTCLSQKKRYVDYFLHLYAAELFRNQSFVLNKSWSYISPERLECVGMNFSCYKAMTVDQSRRMVVGLINQLLDRINADTEMKARHLVKEPFYAKRLRLEIRTDNIFSENSDVASVRLIRFNGNEIVYESYPKSTIYSGSPRTLCRETFEDALMKLDDATLLDQPDNPVRPPSTPIPWTGDVYSPEKPHFTPPSERVKKTKVSEEEFSQGIDLSAPKRELVQEMPFVPGSSTKETIFPSDTAPGFYNDQELWPLGVSVFHQNDFSPERTVCFSSSSFPEYVSTSFETKPAQNVVKDGLKNDVSFNEHPLHYGKWEESCVGFDSGLRYAPPGGWVAFAFYDALSNPTRVSEEHAVSMVERDFPSNSLPVYAKWQETTSWLDREAGVRPLTHTLLSSSSLPAGQKGKHEREDMCWNALASAVPGSLSEESPSASRLIAFSPLPETQGEKHEREDDRWNGLASAVPMAATTNRIWMASRTFPSSYPSLRGSSSLTYTLLSSSSMPLAQKGKRCCEAEKWNGLAAARSSIPSSLEAKILSFSALEQGPSSPPVFYAMREVAGGFTKKQGRMASRIDMGTASPSAFFMRKGLSERVILAHKNAVQEKASTPYVSGRSSSLDTSSSFFEVPTKHVSPADTFIAQATPMKESQPFPSNEELFVPQEKLPMNEPFPIPMAQEEQEKEPSELPQEESTLSQEDTVSLPQEKPSFEEDPLALSQTAPESLKEEMPKEEESTNSSVTISSSDGKTDAERQREQLQILKRSIRSFAAKSASDVIAQPRIERYLEEDAHIAQAE